MSKFRFIRTSPIKSIVYASISFLFLLTISTTRQTYAQTPGAATSGTYKFIIEDNLTRTVEFNASNDDKGTTTGQMTFTDESKISDVDFEEGKDPRANETLPQFYIKVEFDSLTVEKNRAVMGGTVRDSSHRNYIGKWVQLTVEDNVSNDKLPDQLTWGFCQPPAGGWIPTDAERKSDDGAFMRWWATDAERKDDVGIPSKNLVSNDAKGCQIFSLASYSFVDLKRWEGDIVVRQ